MNIINIHIWQPYPFPPPPQPPTRRKNVHLFISLIHPRLFWSGNCLLNIYVNRGDLFFVARTNSIEKNKTVKLRNEAWLSWRTAQMIFIYVSKFKWIVQLNLCVIALQYCVNSLMPSKLWFCRYLIFSGSSRNP